MVAGFQIYPDEENGVHIKVDAGFQMSPDEETGVQMKVYALLQFMYHWGTAFHLNLDDRFHLIRPLRGMEVWKWISGWI